MRHWGMSKLAAQGIGVIVLLVAGLGVWGTQASLAGAVIASGQVELEARRQVVEHPDGGVVQTILVHDGDQVAAGAVLIRLDNPAARSELAITRGQLGEFGARLARLRAERDGDDAVAFPDDLVMRSIDDAAASEVLMGELNLFEARRNTVAAATQSLREQQVQTRNEIDGLEAQVASLGAQADLVAGELATVKGLLDRGLVEVSRVLALQRETARLDGEAGSTRAAIARNRGRIAELDVQILSLATERREDAVTEMRDVQAKQAELLERAKALEGTVARLELVSPMAGVVHGLTVHAIGAVIRPAEPVVYIIPQTDDLIVSARVDLFHVDSVHPGQDAMLRFSSFDARDTPELVGTVSRLSADTTTDERTGSQYYTVELVAKPGQIARLNGQVLIPGMPVESYIATGARSPLSYLLKPFADYFHRAFRE